MADLFNKYLKILLKDSKYLHLLRNNTLKGTKKTDILLCLPRWKNKKITASGLGGDDYINFKLSRKSNKLYGNNGKDTIYGGRAADIVNGGSGNDYLHGFNGNDKIYGGAGKDSIKGGAGDDYVSAGAGNDTVFGNDGKDKLYGGAGDDKIYGNAGDDTIQAGAGDDKIDGGAGNDLIYCDLGRNTIVGGTGDDTIRAGSGVDIFEYEGVSGNDLIYNATSADKIVIKDYNDDSNITLSKNGNQIVIVRTFSSGAQDSITLANRYSASDGLNRIELYNDDTLVKTYNINDYIEGLSSSVTLLKANVASWMSSSDSADIQTTFDDNNTSTTELVSTFVPSDVKI